MTRFVSNERRLVLRILDYWAYLRGERDFPAMAQVNPQDLADDWKHCVLIDIASVPESWSFSHIGGGYDIPGSETMSGVKWTDWDRGTFLGLTTSYIGKVLERRVPISNSGEADEGERVFRYRSVLLPLSDDGHLISGILGAANRVGEDGVGVLEDTGACEGGGG